MLLRLLVLAVLISVSQAFEWKVCETGTFVIDSIDIEPEPIDKKVQAKVRIQGNLTEPIENGTIVAGHVKYLFMNIPIPSQDICKDYRECPIVSGMIDDVVTFDIPSWVPTGTYDMHLRGASHIDETVFCIQGNVTIVKTDD